MDAQETEGASLRGKKMVSIKSLAVQSLPAGLQLLTNELTVCGSITAP